MPPRTKQFNINHLAPLPKDKSIPIGCIGSGFIMADCHLVAYRNAGLNPIAIASRTRKNAQAVADRHQIPNVYTTYQQMLENKDIQVVDVAVPPDKQHKVILDILKHKHIRGILAQKPLGMDLAEARDIVKHCKRAKVTLAVNQNMRYDHSVRACKSLLDQNALGQPIFASIDMRAIPHWMPWQKRLGWVTLRIMSIHHIDTFRYWFGDPTRIYASIRTDPRTSQKFKHTDGICTYILEYKDGLRTTSIDDVWAGPALEGAVPDNRINYRVEGTEGYAKGTIGWPTYPNRQPSTIDYTTTHNPNTWISPRWNEVWFPDAFIGPMADLLIALENKTTPTLDGTDNLKTMALVEAAYLSAKEHRAVSLKEMLKTSN